MRLVNIFSALTGAAAFMMLAVLRHRFADADYSAVLTAGLAQLSTAAAGLAVAGRPNRVNLIGMVMMLVGANIFAGVIYATAINPAHPFHMLAPLGGGLLIASWLVLALASTER